MKGLVFALLLVAPLLAAAQMTSTFRDQVLAGHNEMRRTLVESSNMIEMVWDTKLEEVAQAFVNTQTKENFGHNSDRSSQYQSKGGSGYVGENWYSGSPKDAAQKWTEFEWPKEWGMNGCSEQQNYWAKYEPETANGKKYAACEGGPVGHYTQVMWASSVKVGCGYSAAAGTLCNYAPGGNVNGYTGYLKLGKSCSDCPSGYGKCDSGLCLKDGTQPGPKPSPSPKPSASPAGGGGSCKDKHAVCAGWAKQMSCSSTTITFNGEPMNLGVFCPASCGLCPTDMKPATNLVATTAMYASNDGPGGVGPEVETANDDVSNNHTLVLAGMMVLVVGALGLVFRAMPRSAAALPL